MTVQSESSQLVAGSSHDEIYAPTGSHEIDGGDGEDTLIIYEGAMAEYAFSRTSDGRLVVEGPGLDGKTVRNILKDVERISFTDQIVMTSDINASDDSASDF